MADGEGEYQIRIGAESTQADGALDSFAAKQANLKNQTEDAAAVAQKWGVSLETAQAALDKNREIEKAMQINALAAAMRNANAAAVEGVGAAEAATDANEDEAESARVLQEALNNHQQMLMRNVFYVHRLAEGFKDISMGGRLAGQGLMDVAEVLQYTLAPEMAMYVVIAQVVGMLAIMVTSHRHAGEAARDHAEAARDAADAIGKLAEKQDEISKKKADEAIQRETTALEDLLKAQVAFDDYYKTSSDYAVKAIKDTEARAEAVKKLTLAQMEQKKEEELAGATTEAQRDEIEGRYKVQAASVSGASQAEKGKLERDALNEQLGATGDELRAMREQKGYDEKKYDELKAQADAAAAKAASLGVMPDEGGSFADALKQAEQENHDAVTAYNAAKAKHVAPAALNDLFNQVWNTIPKVRAAKDADDAQTVFAKDNGKLASSIDDLGLKIEKLSNDYTSLLSQCGTLAISTQADQVTTDTDIAKDKRESGLKVTEDNARVKAEADRKKKEQDEALDKSLRDQIERESGAVEASGDKAAIEVLRRIREANEGKNDQGSMIKEIADIMSIHITAQTQINVENAAAIRKLETVQRAHSNNYL